MCFPHSFFDGLVNVSGSNLYAAPGDDQDYLTWLREMLQYAEETNAIGTSAVCFWFVIRLPKDGFSDQIEMHESIPMMIPKSGCGTLIATARTREELEDIVTEDTDEYVYLTYKAKIQGQHAWRALLEFMGKHNMLDRDL